MSLGYGLHGMRRKALTLFYSLRQNGLEPDAVTFVAVLSTCSYTGLVDSGLQIFELMAEHYACVVDMLGRVGRLDEAHNFAKQLGVEGNNLGIWGSLLAACRVHRNFELGKIVSSKLLEFEGSDGISEEGNWQSVDNVRRGLRKMGLSKEVGCIWIDTSGYPHCFVSKDKKLPQYCMIYDMLGYLTVNMKDVGYPKLELIEEWIYGLEE
ncbi:hypothetical protein H5410_055484 [Solanum commersonii]|uniref:Pentatricopeptide repeat-containing protein n=1 Tax=Solanum commersonii TaxID=4109 RepID=A0A9J5WKF2_SOLCO|nr:hypothetical protein H5410_055484 [Solanum commersonii]